MSRSEPVTVFLVEDDEIDFLLMERALKSVGMAQNFVRAEDGIEAYEMLKSGQVPKPYVILLDINMPRMNGLEFLEKIRQDDELKSSLVFMLTTSEDERDISRAYKSSAAGYFLKRKANNGFLEIVKLLQGYWQCTVLPS